MIGFDGMFHMSDEVQVSRVRVPRFMIFSVAVNASLQTLSMLILLFTIGKVDRVSASSLSIIEVYYQATGSRAATNIFLFMLLFIILLSVFNVLTSVSRRAQAFAQDARLPFSRVITKVHPKLQISLNALLLVASCSCLLALINVTSTFAYDALIGLPAIGLWISYFFPILLILLCRLNYRSSAQIVWAPLKLGKAGLPINVSAMWYIVFILIWIPFSAILPVNRLNLNYAGPIFGAVVTGGLLDWYLSGRIRFRLPVARG
ncbi:hypothetical protein T440DRAFT_395107 [Plenodomus tracheiphilus IPT5]|uniref:Amino acid permease/ SLC12A domain-containing protein n=1 Tax=Plenodomus tracheiphilus IPT5 TaxID=1408161 RepID=A0A6A7BAC9_9PLEO|nr:hypothetical protein T440DRAFT_395107 [Plenodomus tracheiphilus IPT5]